MASIRRCVKKLPPRAILLFSGPKLKSDLGLLRGEMGGLKGEVLAAMKADKIDFLKWVVMLIVGQTAVFTALKLLGH